MKKNYTSPELEIVVLNAAEVIATSFIGEDDLFKGVDKTVEL